MSGYYLASRLFRYLCSTSRTLWTHLGDEELLSHTAPAQVLCRTSGSSLGYGFGTVDEDDAEFDGQTAGMLSGALAS